MVSRIGGTGPVPSPNRTTEVAKNVQQSIDAFIKQCETMNPGNSLDGLAKEIIQLAESAKAAQAC